MFGGKAREGTSSSVLITTTEYSCDNRGSFTKSIIYLELGIQKEDLLCNCDVTLTLCSS